MHKLSGVEQLRSPEKPRTYLAEDAESEKRHALGSFAMAGVGVALAGTGLGLVLAGDIGGIIDLAVGGIWTSMYAHEGTQEMAEYAVLHAKAVLKQNQIDPLSVH